MNFFLFFRQSAFFWLYRLFPGLLITHIDGKSILGKTSSELVCLLTGKEDTDVSLTLFNYQVCCSVLQCVAVCRSVSQCVIVCQCVAVACCVLQWIVR